MLRLNGLSITVLYEGGGRQQVTIPGPCSRGVQRWKEIPEAMRKQKQKQGDADNKHVDRGGRKKKDNKGIYKGENT